MSIIYNLVDSFLRNFAPTTHPPKIINHEKYTKDSISIQFVSIVGDELHDHTFIIENQQSRGRHDQERNHPPLG